jgi:hypothetical protein
VGRTCVAIDFYVFARLFDQISGHWCNGLQLPVEEAERCFLAVALTPGSQLERNSIFAVHEVCLWAAGEEVYFQVPQEWQVLWTWQTHSLDDDPLLRLQNANYTVEDT